MFMFSILPCSFLYLIQCKHHSPHSEQNLLVFEFEMKWYDSPVGIQSGAVLYARGSSPVVSEKVIHDSILIDIIFSCII